MLYDNINFNKLKWNNNNNIINNNNNNNNNNNINNNKKDFLNIFSNVATITSGGLNVLNTLQNYKTNKQYNKINYNLLNLQELSKLNYADSIEIEAMENINNAREELNKRIGDLIYQANRRGVKTSSGTIQNNIETSARNLGDDENKLMKQAERQASTLRMSAYSNYFNNTSNYLLQKNSNRFSKNINLLSTGLDVGSSLLGMFLL